MLLSQRLQPSTLGKGRFHEVDGKTGPNHVQLGPRALSQARSNRLKVFIGMKAPLALSPPVGSDAAGVKTGEAFSQPFSSGLGLVFAGPEDRFLTVRRPQHTTVLATKRCRQTEETPQSIGDRANVTGGQHHRYAVVFQRPQCLHRIEVQAFALVRERAVDVHGHHGRHPTCWQPLHTLSEGGGVNEDSP